MQFAAPFFARPRGGIFWGVTFRMCGLRGRARMQLPEPFPDSTPPSWQASSGSRAPFPRLMGGVLGDVTFLGAASPAAP